MKTPGTTTEATPVEQCLAAVELHLRKLPPEFDAATWAIERLRTAYRDQDAVTPCGDDLFDMPLAETKIPVRTVNTLESIGVFTVGDLLKEKRSTLITLPNVGKKSLETILLVISSLGIPVPENLIDECKRAPTTKELERRLQSHGMHAKHSDLASEIEKTLREQGPLLPGQIAKALDVQDSQVRYVLKRSGRRFVKRLDGRLEAR